MKIKKIKSEDIAVCCNMKAATFSLGTLEFCRVQQGMRLQWADRFNVLRFCQLINIHHIKTFPEFCPVHSRAVRCFLRYSACLTDCITTWRWLDEKYNQVQKPLCVTQELQDIVIIRHQLCFDRPVSASPNSLFKVHPSRLSPIWCILQNIKTYNI